MPFPAVRRTSDDVAPEPYLSDRSYVPAGQQPIRHGWAARLAGLVAVVAAFATGTPLAHAADGSWNPIVDPDYLGGARAVSDSVAGAMYLFGGSDRSGTFQNRLWRFDLRGGTGWTSLPPGATPPPARQNPAISFDPLRNRLVLAGDLNSADVWTYSLAAPAGWVHVPVTGPATTSASFKSFTYDPVADRVLAVIFTAANAPIEVWTLPLTAPTWSLLGTVPGLPAAPRSWDVSYDPGGDQVLLAVGLGSLSLYRLSIRGALALSAPTSGGPTPLAFGFTLDTRRHRYLTFAGGDGFFSPESNQTLSVNLAAPTQWNDLTPLAPAIGTRQSMATAYDPIGDRLLVFGGVHLIPSFPFPSTQVLDEFWQQSFGTVPSPWSRVTLVPGPRQNPRMVYASAESCAVLFGGYDGAIHTDVWTLRGSSATRCDLLTPSGIAPPARDRAAVAYDSKRDRVVIFGGWNYPTRYNDVVGVQLGSAPAWFSLTPGGPAPAPRINHQMVYDSIADRFILFGGSSDSGQLNDVWAFDAAGTGAWHPLAPVGPPPSPREYATFVFDAARNRVVLFAGNDGAPRNDTWQLILAGTPAWSPLPTTGTPPPVRAAHMAAYDGIRDRMLIHGGFGSNYLSDVWSLAFADSARWTPLQTDGPTPPARADHALCFDPLGNRLIVSEGVIGNFLGDYWSLAFPAPLTAVPGAFATPAALRALASPNPARSHLELALELAAPGAVAIEFFDLSGRRLASERLALPEGTTHWSVPAASWARVRAAGPGVVWYRVRSRGRVTTGKLAIVE